MFRRDPIVLFAAELERAGVLGKGDFDAMKHQIEREVDKVYLDALEEPPATPASIHVNLFGDEPEQHYQPAISSSSDTTMVAEVNRLFASRIASDPRLLFFGQDIADPKGGVFGFTKGLSSQYPDRVFNSPLAEATIIGAGAGLAATGYRPVFEIQFVDFITPGFNQLTSQAATLRWRSKGDWTCPLVLYMPYGAYLPSGGPWHSQSNEAWFAHTPGLRVAIPSTPEDVVDLFNDAFAAEDPSLILIPKHVFRVRTPFKMPVNLGFGKARVRREGSDVTIVTWGNCVSIALDAAETAAMNGVDVEVLDLRTIVPCDWPAIWESVKKTGRVIVVHEDNRTCGFGQAVIAEIATGPLASLVTEPVLLARPDVHVPYHPDLEASILPNASDILVAIRSMFGDRPWNH
jgi:2-oxoisovalerate dehydrogenase E1 component